MSKESGGPAFPYSGVHHTEEMNYIIDSHGMTLRDYFAAKAMQVLMVGKDNRAGWGAMVSEQAYQMADRMIEARDK